LPGRKGLVFLLVCRVRLHLFLRSLFWVQIDDNWSLQNLLALGFEKLTR